MTILHETLVVAVIVLPLALALVAAVAAFRKFLLNRSRSSKHKHVYSWEAAVLEFSLIAALIGGLLAHDSVTRTEELTQLETRITAQLGPSRLKLHDKQQVGDTMSALLKVINDAHDRDGSIRRVVRALFHPGLMLGPGFQNDTVVGDRFRSLGFPLTYIIGYPTGYDAGDDDSLRARRTQMQRYLFALLTSPEWDKEMLRGVKTDFIMCYVPFARSFDSWEVATNREIEGGLIYFQGTWSGDNDHPLPDTTLTIGIDAIAQSLNDDHTAMRACGTRFIRQQLSLPSEKREPCMIFAHPDSQILRPLSVQDLEEQINAWKYNADDKQSATLQELDGLLRYVKRFHAQRDHNDKDLQK